MITMEEMQTLRQTERRHMIGVKNAFAAGLDGAAQESKPLFPFYKACIDYLKFSLGRFHAQGRGNTDRLRPLVGDNPNDLKIVSDIQSMLDKSETEIAALSDAMDRFEEDQNSGQSAFQDAGARYISFYGSTFVRRKDPAQHIIARHFSDEEYWRLTNDFTKTSIETEQRLYDAVKTAAPTGISLDWNP